MKVGGWLPAGIFSTFTLVNKMICSTGYRGIIGINGHINCIYTVREDVCRRRNDCCSNIIIIVPEQESEVEMSGANGPRAAAQCYVASLWSHRNNNNNNI